MDKSTIGRGLRLASPDRLADVAARHLGEHFGATGVEMLLADYRGWGLWPVLAGDHEDAGTLGDHASAERVFASQRSFVEDRDGSGVRALFPLSVWCDRLGILVVDLPVEPDAETHTVLSSIADEIAMALAAADRGTDRYRRVRRTQRMTMAAEMQWELLPGRTLGGPAFMVAGQLDPAYAVCGDHFDWTLNGGHLTISVLNGDGSGVEATLLTVLAVNAMRNARRSGGGLIEQAELASDALFTQYVGKRHVATLLMDLDLATGETLVIDAGSPIASRLRSGKVTRIELDAQLPLGMFAENRYAIQKFTLDPGDRLVIVSDGVHRAAPGGRPEFGAQELASVVRDTRLQPASDAVATLMRRLRHYHDGNDLDDDGVIVCLDYTGSHA